MKPWRNSSSRSENIVSELPNRFAGHWLDWLRRRSDWQQLRSTPKAFGAFDPRLRPHKIHKLSAIYGKTIHAVEITGDLRRDFGATTNGHESTRMIRLARE